MDSENLYMGSFDQMYSKKKKKEPQEKQNNNKKQTKMINNAQWMRLVNYVNCMAQEVSEPQMAVDQDCVQRNDGVVSALICFHRHWPQPMTIS